MVARRQSGRPHAGAAQRWGGRPGKPTASAAENLRLPATHRAARRTATSRHAGIAGEIRRTAAAGGGDCAGPHGRPRAARRRDRADGYWRAGAATGFVAVADRRERTGGGT